MVAQHNLANSVEISNSSMQLIRLTPEYSDSWCEGLAAAAAWRPEAFAMDDSAIQEARRYFFTA